MAYRTLQLSEEGSDAFPIFVREFAHPHPLNGKFSVDQGVVIQRLGGSSNGGEV